MWGEEEMMRDIFGSEDHVLAREWYDPMVESALEQSAAKELSVYDNTIFTEKKQGWRENSYHL